ncbi:MAG TPA: TOBE domain-containing protein [Pseudolabrys sp.]|jgi:putative spermidine/putrescine transport system ATP-binding protein
MGDRIVVMRKGAIAQIGTPRDIYFAPVSRFVAELIGAANIVEAACEGGTLALPGGRLPLENAAPDGPAIAMIRPESITLVAANGAALSGRVDTVSFVGDRQRLTVSGAASKPIVVDAHNSLAVKPGDAVGLSIESRAIRLLPGERE